MGCGPPNGKPCGEVRQTASRGTGAIWGRDWVRSEIDKLAAPSEDGAVLVWPAADTWPGIVEANRRLRDSYAFEVLGRPVSALVEPAVAEGPVVMAGHQPVFFHPGVWVKGAAASGLARRVGGDSEFLIVDSDAAHGFALRWPEEVDGCCRMCSAAPYGTPDRSFEQLPALEPREWRRFFARCSAAIRAMDGTVMWRFEEGFLGRGTDGSAASDYVERWTHGWVAIDRFLGVQPPATVRVSELFSCCSAAAHCGALSFIAHILLNAEAFAAAYNGALAAYRSGRGVRGRQHPIPDLVIEGDRIELPFWLLHDREPRERLEVSATGPDAIRLWSGSEAVCTLARGALSRDAAALLAAALGDWEIRPRALTLMMYARMFACDLFIHGIGGAKYDQITDEIIRRFFGVEPPKYVCISATLCLPLGASDTAETDADVARRRVRDVRYNPQRQVGDSVSPEVASLIEERRLAVVESGRLRREAPGDRAARRLAFERIRHMNEALLAALPELTAGAQADLETAEGRLEHARIAGSREWFLGLYPEAKLRALQEGLPFWSYDGA